ncbi:hypothetical protein ACIGHN_13500 [Acidovorax sp. NPDC077693]|uniref:hypothetical protein n=1 Tax=unclassified Acidovorax TaxID=2684926 RepID=UPI0037C689AB
MTYQVPPYRPPAKGAPRALRTPFVPVQLVQSTSRRKRPHWLVRAVGVVGKAFFLSFCVFVGLVTFSVAYHYLTLVG